MAVTYKLNLKILKVCPLTKNKNVLGQDFRKLEHFIHSFIHSYSFNEL